MTETGIRLNELCKSVSIHFRHFKVRNNDVNLVVKIRIIFDAIKEIPTFLTIVKHTDIGKAGSFECIHDHLLKKNRIFCNNYRRFINCTIAHFFDFRNLNRSFRRNFCNNFLKVKNGNKLIIALRDTGCYTVIAGT